MIGDLIRRLEREVSFKGLVCPRDYIIEAISYLKEYIKLKEDMKLIKDAVNDPNKDGFDVCRLIKSITDEYDFEEEEDDL